LATSTQAKVPSAKLLHERSGLQSPQQHSRQGDQIVGNVQSGQGTLGKILMNDELYAKVDKGVDNVNTILADVRAQKGTIRPCSCEATIGRPCARNGCVGIAGRCAFLRATSARMVLTFVHALIHFG